MVECPHCGEPVTVGLPKDATVQSVTTEQRATEEEIRTAHLLCPSGHDVYVDYSTETPNPSPIEWVSEQATPRQRWDDYDD